MRRKVFRASHKRKIDNATRHIKPLRRKDLIAYSMYSRIPSEYFPETDCN